MPKSRIAREVDEILANGSEAEAGSETIDELRPRPKKPKSLTNAIIEKAVMAARLYFGSLGGKLRPRDEKKLHDRMIRAIEMVVRKSNGLLDYGNAYRQIHDEAIRRGRILALPGDPHLRTRARRAKRGGVRRNVPRTNRCFRVLGITRFQGPVLEVLGSSGCFATQVSRTGPLANSSLDLAAERNLYVDLFHQHGSQTPVNPRSETLPP